MGRQKLEMCGSSRRKSRETRSGDGLEGGSGGEREVGGTVSHS